MGQLRAFTFSVDVLTRNSFSEPSRQAVSILTVGFSCIASVSRQRQEYSVKDSSCSKALKPPAASVQRLPPIGREEVIGPIAISSQLSASWLLMVPIRARAGVLRAPADGRTGRAART